MTGKRLYQTHREYAAALNEALPEWEGLDPAAQAAWEVYAYEQTLRDRAQAATLLSDQRKDVPYDGCYAD